MKIPRSVKICGHKIKIKIVKNIKEPVCVIDSLGYCDLNHNEIVLRTEYEGKPLVESTKAEVFLHEIIHMANYICGMKHMREPEVRQLGATLFQVIRDNKINFLEP